MSASLMSSVSMRPHLAPRPCLRPANLAASVTLIAGGGGEIQGLLRLRSTRDDAIFSAELKADSEIVGKS